VEARTDAKKLVNAQRKTCAKCGAELADGALWPVLTPARGPRDRLAGIWRVPRF
jgi:hypothetical protein